jgi:hypothetical protein
VVVVGVGDHQGEDLSRGDREGPRVVQALPFRLALERAAVDDEVLLVRGDVEEVDGTRHRTTSAVGLVEERRVAGLPGLGDRRHARAELRLRRGGRRGEGRVVHERAEDGADVGGGGILRSIHTHIGSLAPDLGGGAMCVAELHPGKRGLRGRFRGWQRNRGEICLKGVRCMEAQGGDGVPVFIGRNVFHVRADYF